MLLVSVILVLSGTSPEMDGSGTGTSLRRLMVPERLAPMKSSLAKTEVESRRSSRLNLLAIKLADNASWNEMNENQKVRTKLMGESSVDLATPTNPELRYVRATNVPVHFGLLSFFETSYLNATTKDRSVLTHRVYS